MCSSFRYSLILKSLLKSRGDSKPCSISIEELPYLCKLYLLLILNSRDKNNFLKIEEPIVSSDYDESLLGMFYEMGILFYLGAGVPAFDKIIDAKSTILSLSSLITLSEDQVEICQEHMNNMPKEGVRIILPSDQVNFDATITNLHRSLENTMEIVFDEITYLEDLIKNVLVSKAYRIIDIAKNRNNIPVKVDMFLHQVMQEAVWKFPLKQLCSLIFYQAKQLAAEIHANRFNHFEREHIFANKIKNSLAYFENNPNAKVYELNIPDIIVSSRLEKLTCVYIFNDIHIWERPGIQILKKWIDSPNLKY